MSKSPPFSIGKAFFINLFDVATEATKENSAFPSYYNATNKAIIQVIESMNNEKIQEIKEFITGQNKHLKSDYSTKVLDFKNFINEISNDVLELNNELYKLLCLLKDIQSRISFVKKYKVFFDKQVAKSAEIYVQYVKSLENILSIKRELNLDLTKSEKDTLKELQLVRNGLGDLSITIKDIYLLSLPKKKNKKIDIRHDEFKIKYSLNSSIHKSNKYFSV